MKKTFLITEQEKYDIRRMYGLLIETPQDEVISYLDYYLSSKNCNQIAGDFETYQKTPGFTSLSKEEQKKIDQAITGFKNPGLATSLGGVPCSRGKDNCQCVKDYMKSELVNQLNTDQQKVISQVCSMTATFPPKTPLTICGGSPAPDKKDNVVTGNKDVNIDNNSNNKSDLNVSPPPRTSRSANDRIFNFSIDDDVIPDPNLTTTDKNQNLSDPNVNTNSTTTDKPVVNKPKPPVGKKPRVRGNDNFPLKRGSYGPKVKELQNALLRYNSKILPKYGADSSFGKETENALLSILHKKTVDNQSELDGLERSKRQFYGR